MSSSPQGGHELNKSVSFFGLVALGLGGVWGTSWLIMSSDWLGGGGGVINALLAWALILVVELPFVLAYRQAVPMFPRAEGEMSYADAAFGRKVGFWAAWFGVLVNLIVCAYEVVALVRMAIFLVPGIGRAPALYTLFGSDVTWISLVLGIALVVGISAIHFAGVNLSSKFTSFITTTLMVLTIIGIVLAFLFGDVSNYRPVFGKPVLTGVIAVAATLPFSFAGWESIAKGAEEASDNAGAGRAVPVAWFSGWLAYALSLAATGMVMPWQQSADTSIPFATGLGKVTGAPIIGQVLVLTALLGVIGVYNALFYSMTRQMFGMSRQGLLPRWFAALDPKTKAPRRVILFTTAILLVAPFLGKGALLPLVLASSFAYIVLWGLTYVSMHVLRRRYRGTAKQFRLPGGIVTDIVGYAAIAFMLAVFLIPSSPGALKWPEQYLILLVLIVIGAVLYVLRDKSTTGDDQAIAPTEAKPSADADGHP